MSRYTVLGDAVVTSLNDASFSEDFTSTRRYRPIVELKELSDLTVTVIIPSVTQEISSRSLNTDIMIVDVLVQQQANADDNDEVDPLIDLCEEIGEHFRGVDFDYAMWVKTEVITTYDMEDLASFRVFSGLIRVTYRFSWRK